jgi:hypothetical protein
VADEVSTSLTADFSEALVDQGDLADGGRELNPTLAHSEIRLRSAHTVADVPFRVVGLSSHCE